MKALDNLQRGGLMKKFITAFRRVRLLASLGGIALAGETAWAQVEEVRIVQISGYVDILRNGTTNWTPTTFTNLPLNSFDRIRVGTNSSAGIYIPGQNVVRFEARTEVEIGPQAAASDEHSLNLIHGILSFFHRSEPGRIHVLSSGGTAGIKGTEFVMSVLPVNGVEQTTVSVLDGEVNFTNATGACQLTNGQQAVAAPGTAPVTTAGFIANNLLQWCFYYPGVLDLNDVSPEFAATDKNIFSESVALYRAGDLRRALTTFPDARPAANDAEHIFHATLLLNGAQISDATKELDRVSPASEKNQRLVNALRMLIAAVKHEPFTSTLNPQLATEFLAASYYAQSQPSPKSLDDALRFARRAVEKSPAFGFGWERVAELEFSFGHTDRAAAALESALRFSPANAEALSLKGFLLAAQNKNSEASTQFDRALAIDSALGNAWLGRGLCHLRRGEAKAGREDLLIAAAMEPQRATLRSYLGKAFGDAGNVPRAVHELALAKNLDPNDPTAWLYSALLNEQNNRVNEAVRDLEKSQELNQNRGVYRSSLLLDQDRAVRSVNLARIYAEAGLDDVALREASRAVSADYANFSSHLFLANSYQQLRNSSPFDLRYETPAFSEYLIASLLGPADGRLLAQPVSQQEYTRLFDRDSYGFSSSSEYLSRGAFNQYAAQYGTQGKFSYALESQYNWDPGQTPNGSQETKQVTFKLKQMLTPKDGLFFEIQDARQDRGDTAQYYDPANQANPVYKAQEKGEPNLLVGLDHQWSEHQHTLLLASFFNDQVSQSNPDTTSYLLKSVNSGDPPFEFSPVFLAEKLENHLTTESLEVQHLVTSSHFQTIAGMRFQAGTYRLGSDLSWSPIMDPFDTLYFPNPSITNQSFSARSLRLTPYLYEHWHLTSKFCLIGGLAYDYQSLPQNPFLAPLGNGDRIEKQLSPKAGMVWEPTTHSSIRAAYAQSLGGANLDQSLRLEPTQLAGFAQAYRNLIPSSLAAVGGERFETFDFSIANRFETGTYVGLSAELLHSTDRQSVGAFAAAQAVGGSAIQLAQQLAFTERSLDFSVHQLLGKNFSVGTRYRLSDAHMDTLIPEVNPGLGTTHSSIGGLLHLFSLNASFQNSCGYFASVEGQWWHQELRDNLAAIPGDDFWQANAMIGYRSSRRHFEASVGLLNIAGQDYHLHPINLYPDLPRQQTLAVRLQVNF